MAKRATTIQSWLTDDADQRLAEIEAAGHMPVAGRNVLDWEKFSERARAAQDLTTVGQSVPLVQGVEYVTGRWKYGVDVQRPGMLYSAILRSPFPHAKILKIDTSKAEALPGVGAVLTHKDVPAIPLGSNEFYVLEDTLRFVGDEVAVVAAVDKSIAEDALDLIEIEYEQLPAIYDPEAALKPGAPAVHPGGNLVGGKPLIMERGDIEQGFADADLILEGDYKTQVQVTAAIGGARSCVVEWDASNNFLTDWDSTQIVWGVQGDLSKVLELPLNKIRVLSSMGAGHGDGNKYRQAPMAALLARKTGAPVQVEFTREGEFLGSQKKRHPAIFHLKMGVKRDGTITAIHVRSTWNKGAYSTGGSSVPIVGGGTFTGMYTCPNVKYEADIVYTNLPPVGAYRGYGNPQASFAQELHIDKIAEELGMDALEFRLKNYARVADQATGKPYSSIGLEECILQGAKAIGWEKRNKTPGEGNGPKKRGIGMAIFKHTSGSGLSSATVKVNADGTVHLITGTVDMGTGSDTTLSQIAAEELGVAFEGVTISSADTQNTPYAVAPTASKTCHVAGLAVMAAARDTKQQLFELAVAPRGKEPPLLEAKIEDLEARDGMIFPKEAPEKAVSFAQVVKGQSVIGRASTNQGSPDAVAQSFGAQFVEVEVDVETGEVRVLKLVAAHDVGRAINPGVVVGQIIGAAHHGLGYALTEELLVDEATGVTLNPNLHEYKMLTTLDMPPVEVILIEPGDPLGPFGAKGVGEPGLVPTAPAITNAVYNAIGVWIHELPITRAKILDALKRA